MLCDCHWGFCEMPRFATHGPFNLGVAAMLWDTSTGTMSILSAAHLSDFHGISHDYSTSHWNRSNTFDDFHHRKDPAGSW